MLRWIKERQIQDVGAGGGKESKARRDKQGPGKCRGKEGKAKAS